MCVGVTLQCGYGGVVSVLPQPNHNITPTHIEPDTTHEVTQRISRKLLGMDVQGAAERTPRFGRVIASDGERVQLWGACRRTAVYMPFSVYTMVWLGKHRAFIVEEFIKNGRSPCIPHPLCAWSTGGCS